MSDPSGASRLAAVGPALARITPAPTDEETAAIVAALELAWPRPMVVVDEPVAEPSRWRWSGRWWAVRDGGPADRRRP